ncbi:MAG: nitroreductase [Candidatus Scalindua sp. AMX11]|nr:MAG: nitroreductase [Candidatus Scalindua sp.]NOG85369.1 nitroreductase family protein [Planctomycetota bacterium]RZV83968.1 MAG: nitroreductase [Candidatus Scalindua sp. SCAELEC01]TDE65749.1 MAG: nitroreductase [Candidatus Scalindua sp. AMX11]GJQ59643.1 MAG: nitroreductase [Candidatus Scalindua sp.]
MSVYETVIRRRTIRRFKQTPLSDDLLKRIVNAGRLAPSSANLQPIEYVVIDKPPFVEKVFATLKWAGYISPEGDPPLGERPVAYLAILINNKKSSGCCQRDAAAAIENMILVALEEDVGSCWLGSIDRDTLQNILKLPEYIIIDSVLALGYSNETPAIERLEDSVKYWKDKEGTLHVPKRDLGDVLFYNEYLK